MKRILTPLLLTILTFAIMHVILLLILTVITGNISYLNIFFVVGITEFIPGAEKGILSTLLSVIIIGAVFSFYYLKRKQK